MMATKEESQLGICSTCNYIDTCTSRKNWKGPVFFCEEFSDYIPLKKIPEKRKIQTKSEVKDSKRKEMDFKGLCINCEYREVCIHSRQEGGIWHCEEYE